MDINKGLKKDNRLRKAANGTWNFARNIIINKDNKSSSNEKGFTDEINRRNIRPKDSRNKKNKTRGDINGEELSENQP